MQDVPDVDVYLAASRQWPDEVRALRPLLLASGLDEHVTWGKPCYALGDRGRACRDRAPAAARGGAGRRAA